MTWLASKIPAAEHVLDPSETTKAARLYSLRYWPNIKLLTEYIAIHKRAIEHEQAILEGMNQAYEEMINGR